MLCFSGNRYWPTLPECPRLICHALLLMTTCFYNCCEVPSDSDLLLVMGERRALADVGFVGGGLWHPEAAPTAAMRRDIDLNPERIKNILTGDGVRKAFLNDASKQETKVVKAFVASNAANALKTKPKVSDAPYIVMIYLSLRE